MALPTADQHRLRSRRQTPPLSVDGVQHRPAGFQHRAPSRPAAAAVAAPAIVMQPVERPVQKPKPVLAPVQRSGRPYELRPDQAARPSFWQRLQLPLLILTGMVAGFFVQSLAFGIVIIVTYGLVATIFHVPSRITFALAFISLLTVPVLLLLKSNVELASNFATYTFLLLVIGVIALSIEARPQERKRTRRRGR